MIFTWEGKYGGTIKLLTINFFLIGTIIDLRRLFKNEYDGLEKVSYYGNMDVSEGNDEPRISDEGIAWSIGSNKQIDWAERICSGVIRKAKEMAESSAKDNLITEQEKDSFISALGIQVVGFDDTNWWIDIRDENLKKKLYLIFEDNEEMLNIVKKMAY